MKDGFLTLTDGTDTIIIGGAKIQVKQCEEKMKKYAQEKDKIYAYKEEMEKSEKDKKTIKLIIILAPIIVLFGIIILYIALGNH